MRSEALTFRVSWSLITLLLLQSQFGAFTKPFITKIKQHYLFGLTSNLITVFTAWLNKIYTIWSNNNLVSFLSEQILCLCSKVVFYVFFLSLCHVINSKLKSEPRILTLCSFNWVPREKWEDPFLRWIAKHGNKVERKAALTPLWIQEATKSPQKKHNKGKYSKLPLYTTSWPQ